MVTLLEKINSEKRNRASLSDVATVVPGFAFKSSDFTDYGVPVVKITEIQSPYVNFDKCTHVDISKYPKNKLDKFYLHKGEYVVAMTGATVGKVGKIVTDTQAILNQRVAVVRPKPEVSREFIELQISSDVFQKYIKQIASGSSAQANISGDDIGDFEISLPNISMQKKIAEILNPYDAKIENNNTIIKNLEIMAQTIFDEWFVKFHFPEHVKTKLVKSEIGFIPEGWRIQKLGDVIDLAYGSALRSEDRESGPYPVVGSSGIVGFHKDALVSGPGIVVGRKGNVGSIMWIDQDFYPIDTTFFVVSKLDLYFCFFMLKRQVFHSGDSAVPGLSREVAYSNNVLVPPTVLQRQYSHIANKMFAQISEAQKENYQLKESRDLLIAKLI